MEKKENGTTPLLEYNRTFTGQNGVKIVKSPTKSKNGSLNSQIPDSHEVRFVDVSDESNTSSRESLKDDIDLPTKPKLPDGGWGWMVVFSSLVISMIADGISFSFGLLYIEFLYEFEETKSATSWIGSLFMAVPLLTGPIMSALVDRYGCRLMTIVGGLISGLGFILCYFAKTILVCYLTFGVIAGLGLGLCYVTAVVSIAFWFDKKRNLAIGLGACGTGIGTFVYAPMTQYFIEQYGWRGCVLLLAGTFLNMCVCGCLMRDPDWMIEESKLSKSSKKSSTSSTSVSGRSFADDFPNIEELKDLLQSGGKDNDYLLQTLATSINSMENAKSKNIHRSDISLPTFVKQNEKVPLEVLRQLSANTKLYNVILENYPSLLSCRSTSDNRLNKLHNAIEADPTRVPVTVSMKIKKNEHKEDHKEERKGDHKEERKEELKEERKEEHKDEEIATNKRTRKLVHQVLLYLKIELKKIIIIFIKGKCTYLYSLLTLQQSLPAAKHESAVHTERKTSLDHGTLRALQRSDSVGWLLKQLGTNTHNNFKNIKLHRNSVMYRGAMLNIHKYHLRASSCPDIYRNSMITLAQSDKEKRQYIKTSFIFSGFLFDITQEWKQSFLQAALWIIVSGVFILCISYSKNKRIIGSEPLEMEKVSEAGSIA
ncbi:monocarboxylate transporter [Holotrichia oblita]|uniref:Monocarboxylate transporter n=1 Tax=Holotrichia oblita TaxID=644536 RepID=A0ACB9SRJ2_HOLOL|nr:monocarboxylate transporter [Holotrichia oblita]